MIHKLLLNFINQIMLPNIIKVLFFCVIVCNIYSFNIEGEIRSEIDKQLIEFGTVAINETQIKVRFSEGKFSIAFPKEGDYTFIVSSPGFSFFKKVINIKNNQKVILELSIAQLKANTITLHEKRQIQTLSRTSLTQEEVKKTPSTFGDALNAVAILPGVNRASSLTGTLNIRGADSVNNRYFVDGIPVLYAQHFNVLQSIISSDFIGVLDVYSSSAPTQFGESIGGIIDIKTKDSVKNFNGKGIINVISTDLYLEGTFPSSKVKDKTINSDLNTSSLSNPIKTNTSENTFNNNKSKGYWITSGRVGYLALTLVPLLRYGYKYEAANLPQYYDWQTKGHFFLDDDGKHSLSILYFGFFDTLSFSRNVNSSLTQIVPPLNDPLTNSLSIKNDILSNNIGFTYTFQPSSKLNNQLLVFSAINNSYLFLDLPSSINLGAEDKKKDIKINSNLIGLKNKFSWDWLNQYSTLVYGFEFTGYFIQSKGESAVLSIPKLGVTNQDYGLSTSFYKQNLNFSKNHLLLATFLENSFKFFGIEITPGVRVNYLATANKYTIDPKVLALYKTFWDMTFSAAIGWYSSFPQINFLYFNQGFNQQPLISTFDLKPEKSRHISAGIEQSFGFLSAKIEGFYNTTSDLIVINTAGTYKNAGEGYLYGMESLLRFVGKIKETGLFGILGYSYTVSKLKSGWTVPNQFQIQYDSNKYYDSPSTPKHSFKLVTGVLFSKNTIALKYQVNSGLPYTPIVGSYQTPGITIDRYSPSYGEPLSRTFNLSHSLDIRYSRTFVLKWGSMDVYIEVQNVYYNRPLSELKWDFSKPFSGNNPNLDSSFASLLIPNFGIEVRF